MGGKARGLKDWSWRILGCDPAFACALLVAQLWLGLLWFFYQGQGIVRGAILGVVLLGLFVLRFRPRPASVTGQAGATALTATLRALLLVAVLLDLTLMAVSGMHSLRTGKIPMDEGQTSWRAARLLSKRVKRHDRGASLARSRRPEPGRQPPNGRTWPRQGPNRRRSGAEADRRRLRVLDIPA